MRWKEETILFETFREADVWADSIANEIHGRTIDGYCTPDYKIACALAFYLAQVPISRVRTREIPFDEIIYYQVWIETSQ
ncbi:hypothetical protein BLD48_13170 [Exiguobacterium sp. KRL4]|nr:hypothetical protein [Exiguobacterium sp. KRL4]OIN65975.1 hypothetical protein BLD48_13170 [Exiguobacterium sp. KRL4]